jgi:hypothetical protein
MSRRCLVLVEGQTEERFVKDVLAPYFWDRNMYLTPTLLVTRRVKAGPNFKGGVTSFARIENDLRRLLVGAGDAVVTTILDYYGLPTDFPGYNTRPPGAAKRRVDHLEAALREHLGRPPDFVPFLALHEFEAWLFADASTLPQVMAASGSPSRKFEEVCSTVDSPEEINDRPEFTPARRIQTLFPGYRKPIHGPATVGRIGINRIRNTCPHFSAWIDRLEEIARLPSRRTE